MSMMDPEDDPDIILYKFMLVAFFIVILAIVAL